MYSRIPMPRTEWKKRGYALCDVLLPSGWLGDRSSALWMGLAGWLSANRGWPFCRRNDRSPRLVDGGIHLTDFCDTWMHWGPVIDGTQIGDFEGFQLRRFLQ